MARTYEVNTIDLTYQSANAKTAASVAACWSREGLDPSAFVIVVNDRIECREVPITTVRETARALATA